MPRFSLAWPVCHGFLLSCAIALLSVSLAAAASPTRKDAAKDVPAQPLFEAIAAGDLEVGVVPRDAKQVTLNFRNKTERPLTIQLPPALAAVPVLAQQPGLFGGFPQNNNGGGGGRNGGQQAPQQLGLGGGGMGNGGGMGQGNLPGGMFNIPAGRAIKVKVACVCLEYGKPDPDARMKYELKPLTEVNASPALAQVLRSLGDELVDQRVAQAAAWHLTDDLSWDKLASLVNRHLGGAKEMQFQTNEVAAAKALIEKLTAEKNSSETKPARSSSTRVSAAASAFQRE